MHGTILLMAVLALAVHILANVLGGDGYFRDELYYIACSGRLAAGYVDHPPLSILFLAGAERVFGGLLNKTSALWLGAGVGAAILLSGQLRRQLATPGPYVAAALALALFSPYVIWNALHGWPHIEFMRNATAGKYSSLTRARFLADQFPGMNPLTCLISLPGLAWCLSHREGRRWRPIGIIFLTVFAVLLGNPHTKSEYMAAAYPMLFAAGGGVEPRRRFRPDNRMQATACAVARGADERRRAAELEAILGAWLEKLR